MNTGAGSISRGDMAGHSRQGYSMSKSLTVPHDACAQGQEGVGGAKAAHGEAFERHVGAAF